jgi:hypothetical protein
VTYLPTDKPSINLVSSSFEIKGLEEFTKKILISAEDSIRRQF